LHIPKGPLQLYDAGFNTVAFLGEGSEAVNFRYDRLVPQVPGTPINYGMISVLGRENIQVFLGVNGPSCEGEEGRGVERSGVDKVGLIYNAQHHGIRSHDNLDVLGLPRDPMGSDGTGDVSGSCVEVESWRCV